MTNPHFYSNLDHDEGIAARCLALIERHAPRMMVAGGGGLKQEMLGSGRRLTPEHREAIRASLRATNGTAMYRLGKEHGVSQGTVCKIWQKMQREQEAVA
jgi:hypothetical protein